MFVATCNGGTAATSGSAGWGRGSWSRRSSFAGSRDTSRFRRSSKNWKLWRRLSWGLSNGERRRRVGYAGVATFNGVPGILPSQPEAWQRRGATPTGEVHESFCGCGAGFPPAKVLHHFVVPAVDFLAVLAFVGKQRCFLLFSQGRDVNVISGMKAHGL